MDCCSFQNLIFYVGMAILKLDADLVGVQEVDNRTLRSERRDQVQIRCFIAFISLTNEF